MSTMPAKQFTVRDPSYVERVKDAFSRQGFLRHVDARVEEIAPGRCVIAADFRSELAQQSGFFHGGLLGTIADAAGAGAAATLIEAQQWLLTAEATATMLRLADDYDKLADRAARRPANTLISQEKLPGPRTRPKPR